MRLLPKARWVAESYHPARPADPISWGSRARTPLGAWRAAADLNRTARREDLSVRYRVRRVASQRERDTAAVLDLTEHLGVRLEPWQQRYVLRLWLSDKALVIGRVPRPSTRRADTPE